MRINEITIHNVGCISNLKISFNENINVLCGPNSIGKTTILESIASMFMYGNPTVKRNVLSDAGCIDISVNVNGNIERKIIDVTVFDPHDNETHRSFTNYARNLLSIKVNRNFSYSPLSAVPSDADRSDVKLWESSRTGISFNEVKGWFVNRYLYSARPETLSKQQIANYKLAERCFAIIHPLYSFSRVLGSSNDIMVNTPQGEIYFEYLSSGFKSILFMLFSIIKEIEFRFKEHNLTAEEFDGVVLIDEVEIHLHPEWQERIVSILNEAFPNVQFIMTTHSPHVIQTVEPNQILALRMNDDGNISLRDDMQISKYGFKGWTVEEILYDVMGMKSLRTEIYHKLMCRFGEAIDKENPEEASSIYCELDNLLHPGNPQRKLLQFQLAKISKG